ncbi:MAG: adenylate/guanylate cyclase domain-containing protein [Alphaproteobacteria bacterium]|nr:adenylate/guanylate cyclase domain-containing protein [Alphaproteobacteria bacterium]
MPVLLPMPSFAGSYDGPLGQKIIELHVWAVGQGLRGAEAAPLFDEFCQSLVSAGVPLWRAFAGMRTLHPQWGGYGYTWRRRLNAIEPQQFERGDRYEQGVLNSPIGYLIRLWEVMAATAPAKEARSGLHLRRRLSGAEAQLDFPLLEELAAAGATDYFAEVVRFGAAGDASRGTGVGYSFATDRPCGFDDDDLGLLKAVLPVVSLAMMAHASHTIASSLLEAYLGADAGRRVHAGAIERGSVESIRAVLWYADIRGFTAIADTIPGAVVIELLDEIFETLTAALRSRGGQVLKFLGDGMLAIFPFDDATREEICRRALDGAADAMRAVDRLNAARCEAGKPSAAVDLALHLGEVLYGNVGAVDRLDFTVIGPAVNEVARIETLCEPLGRKVLVSAALAAAVAESSRLEPLGTHVLRGVRDPREIYGLDLG